jgi:hypothetical protein
VIHFGDNTAANAVAIKGTSSAADLSHLAHNLLIRLVSTGTTPWFAWVPSKANISDDPSRNNCSELVSRYRGLRVGLVFPNFESLSFSSDP